MKVSVIISTRDEGNNLSFTVHSIANDLATFLNHDEWEIIIVHNNPTVQEDYLFLMKRGMHHMRNVRVLFDPIAGNVTARNKGTAISKGEYIFFSDAHMSYPFGTFKNAIETIQKNNCIVHGAVQWMGGFEPSTPSYQYTIKVGEKLWGNWNNSKISDSPFAIPSSGHCFLGMRREIFKKLTGYNNYFRCYGGGELYLSLKAWLYGVPVLCDPRITVYHLSAGRGYSYHNNDLIHNMILLGYALNADALAERVYLRYYGKEGVRKEVMNAMREEAWRESQSDRDAMRNARMTLYELLVDKPWDKWNDEVHGTHASAMSIFDDTWTSQLSDDARVMFDSSPLQKEFHDFVACNLAQHVYKGTV